jgi:diaminopimelate decarboxylase
MVIKLLPSYLVEAINNAVKFHKTPFYLYDECAIKSNVKNFLDAFKWNNNFKQFFAVKALPNPYILSILKRSGLGVDCSSLTELLLAEKCGFSGDQIFFTSNNTPLEDYEKALELGAIINLDDINHIEFLNTNLYLPELLSFRYNPSEFKFANTIIGNPKESKFGLTKEQLFVAYKTARDYGVKYFGLHVMVASNELNPECFIENARSIFELAHEIINQLGISLEFINLGGGLGILGAGLSMPGNLLGGTALAPLIGIASLKLQ